jgi:site-specific DNA-methyltransferase (adenine-specific)/adenine-specific DNA-methyltransferase
VTVSLEDFAVYYTQENLEATKAKIKPEKEGIIMEDGHIYKIRKDKDGNITENIDLTSNRIDWIDYWAVDFDYSSKKETIRHLNEQ